MLKEGTINVLFFNHLFNVIVMGNLYRIATSRCQRISDSHGSGFLFKSFSLTSEDFPAPLPHTCTKQYGITNTKFYLTAKLNILILKLITDYSAYCFGCILRSLWSFLNKERRIIVEQPTQ